MPQCQQLAVARDQVVRFRRDCRSKDEVVLRMGGNTTHRFTHLFEGSVFQDCLNRRLTLLNGDASGEVRIGERAQ
jgi:hypothetical protein